MSEAISILSAFGTGYVLGTATTLVLLKLLVPHVMRANRRIDAEEGRNSKHGGDKNGTSE